MPEHLTKNAVSKNRITVKWESEPEIDSYEVTALTSQGTKSSCSVGQLNSQATCEGLSQCKEYNISVRPCNTNSGCGEPAMLTVITFLGRKFAFYIFHFWAVLHIPACGQAIRGLILDNKLMQPE